MPRLNLNQKTNRVLLFLIGIRNPDIATKLVLFGFTQEDLDEGWSLLQQAVDSRLDLPVKPEPTPSAILELDAFENKWFPIVKATLSRRYPELRDRVFLNLRQTEGAEVVVSVSTFISRIDGLETTDEGEPDSVGIEARELLAQRGLTQDEVDHALLTILGVGELEAPATPETYLEEVSELREAAEQELWSWYLEWSTIARTAITNRSHLRSIGFLKPKGSDKGDGSTPTAPEETPL